MASNKRQGMLQTFLFAAGAALLALGATRAEAQGSIYTCIDSKGRRLTSDRPITECLDREQTELNRNGTVKRTVKPEMTASERAAQEERDRKLYEERMREQEEKRRERALLARYPDRAAHDLERSKALDSVQLVTATAQKRIVDLQKQRQALMAETEFYKGDLTRIPAKLKRQIEENEQHLDAQKRFIANQDDEKKRVNARFDSELARLTPMWEQMRAAAAAASGRR